MPEIKKTDAIDHRLAMRADRKLRRYGADLNGLLAFLVTTRGNPLGKPIVFPTQHAVVPSVIEFDEQGEHFVADVTPDGDSYFAQVRGLEGCFTCGDTEAEIRKNLGEVTRLMHFDMGEAVRNPDGGVYA